MKKKWLILGTIILLTITHGFSQDTSKVSAGKSLRNSSDTLNPVIDSNTPTGNPNRLSTPHATVNPNRGTLLPNTTSGTLNSSVNPNTQFVIPLHKGKRKSKVSATPDSGQITPK